MQEHADPMQNRQTTHTADGFVRIWEKATNVRFSSRTQQGIRKCVRQYVRIGVTLQPT
jgi:hypothetical protein